MCPGDNSNVITSSLMQGIKLVKKEWLPANGYKVLILKRPKPPRAAGSEEDDFDV